MMHARWFHVFATVVSLGLCADSMQGSGLSVRADGVLLRGGTTYRGIGVNYFDAFARTLKDHKDTSYEAGFRALAENQIPFARFMCTGFWPAEMKLYLENKAEYFRLLDGVIQAAQKHGVGLIPSLFWYIPTVPDLVHEPCDQWGNPNSRTHEFMRAYTREVVTRYLDSPTIWGWEFGNEFDLSADLPNAKEHLPPIVPKLGTAQTRSDRDILTHEMARTAFREFAKEIRKIDRTRIICTGNSIPRPSAWHQIREGTWTKDSPEQYAQVLAEDNPDLMDTITVHLYEPEADRLAGAMQTARRQKKPLFVGEFGVQGDSPEVRQQFQILLDLIERMEVPLAALWVFDYRQQTDRNITADNGRGYQLKAISEANQRLQHTYDVSAETLRDKIRGGLLGQILGDLNGLPHEMKYIAEPGSVTGYTPSLPQGA